MDNLNNSTAEHTKSNNKLKVKEKKMSYKRLTTEEKTARAEARKQARKEAKELEHIRIEQDQNPVKRIEITIEWKKSRMYGSNPHLEATIFHRNGQISRATATCSGCGYDKESTVIADVFNQTLKYKLWDRIEDIKKKTNIPYGINLYSENNPHFGGGIGTECYYDIAKFIGGTFKSIASGKTFDVFEFTDNE